MELELRPEDVAGKKFYYGKGCDDVQQHRLQGPAWASTRSCCSTTTCAT